MAAAAFVAGVKAVPKRGQPTIGDDPDDAVPPFRSRRHDRSRDRGGGGRDRRLQRATPGRRHWVFAGGLASPSTATVVDGRGGEPVFIDGPYVESKEHVAGFWIIEAANLDVALRLAAQGSKSCNRRVELRPFLGE
jgi:hypothetical protein